MSLRTAFDEWLALQRGRSQPPLFPDIVPPAPPLHDCAADGHLYASTEAPYPGAPGARATWTCTICGHVRGRC